MLTELTAQDFASFKEMVVRLSAVTATGMLDLRMMARGESPGSRASQISPNLELALAEEHGGDPATYLYLGLLKDGLRLFRLAKEFGLGQEGAAGFFGAVSGPNVLRIQKDSVLAIREILVPSTVTNQSQSSRTP
jgi:hypothetical protein